MAFVDATIVNIAFPDIRQSFPETTIAGLSWVLNAYNIVFAAFLVAAGSLADLLGRKRTFEAGLVLFTFASALCALATSPTLLIAARVVQALGAAVVVPASLALVLEAFPAGERTHAVALWTAVAALAAGVGPSLGGLLVELGGWRLAFLVNIPVGIAAVLLARSRLVESRSPGRRRLPDVAGALLFALAVATVTLALVKGNEWGWTLGGHPRHAGGRAPAGRRVRPPLQPARGPAVRPRAVAGARVLRRERAHDRRRRRFLRVHALQRAVPHGGVGVLGAPGRPGADAGAVRGRRRWPPPAAAWPSASACGR